jgi:hypothetical protein
MCQERADGVETQSTLNHLVLSRRTLRRILQISPRPPAGQLTISLASDTAGLMIIHAQVGYHTQIGIRPIDSAKTFTLQEV